ncbi:MAG: CPBP family intramembrane metalloprotease [bacterium]|nr:CPBP family intramembrane metalloprotease [bacterium]
MEFEQEYIPDSGERIPGIKDLLLILLLSILFLFALVSVFFAVKMIVPLDIEFLLIEAFMVIPAIFYLRVKRFSLIGVFRFRTVSLKTVGVSIIFGLSLIFLLNFVENQIDFLPMPDWYRDLRFEMAEDILNTLVIRNTYELIVLSFAVIFSAGFGEEILFRGLLQKTLEHKMPAAVAIFITSLLFSILHPASVLTIFFLAVVLGIITYKTDSIFPAIIIHSMNNGISLLSLNLSDDLQLDPTTGIPVPINMMIISLFIFILGLQYFLTTNKKEVRDNGITRNI